MSRCKKRENSIREQRDLWRVRAIKLEQMCTGLKDDLSAAIEAAKTLVQSNAQAGETRPEVGGFDTALEAECKGDLAALSQGEVYSYVQSISSGLDAWSSGSAGLPAKGRATRPASAAHPRTSQSRPGSARPKPSGKSRPKSALPTSGTTNLLGRISQAPERPAVSGEKHESVIRVRDLCPPPETMDGKGDDTAPLAMRASATGLTDHSNSSASPVAPPGGLTTGSVSKPELRPKQVGRCSSGYSATIPEEEAPDQRDASSSGYRSSEKLVQPSHECQRQPDINIAGMHGSRTSIYTSGENTPLSGASLPQPRQRPASARPLPTSSARPPSARPNHARPRPMSAVTPQWSSYSDLAQTSDSGGCRPQVVSSAVDGTRREYRTSSQETSSATSTVIRRAQSAGCDKHYKSAAADKLVRRGQSASDFIRRTRSEFMYNGRPFS